MLVAAFPGRRRARERPVPDLLVFRTKEGSGLTVDILDPHTHSLADAADKARGLAEYADRHFNLFGRIGVARSTAYELVRAGDIDSTVFAGASSSPSRTSPTGLASPPPTCGR